MIAPTRELEIRFGYTPDPDDAFHYFALEHGLVPAVDGWRPVFRRDHVQTLNEMALGGELEVTAISSAFYPRIDDRYRILSSGASVGRGYGPVLASRAGIAAGSWSGRRVAVPGLYTTGCLLLRYFHPGAELLPMPFDRVATAVAAGEADGGVLIHEELLRWDASGLVKVECLGRRWLRRTGLPLPVGLVVGRRDLGEKTLASIVEALRRSLELGRQHRGRALDFACRFGTGARDPIQVDFVDKFANDDTLDMPADVRRGLRTLYREALVAGLIERLPRLDVL